jgi:ribosomal protein L15E
MHIEIEAHSTAYDRDEAGELHESICWKALSARRQEGGVAPLTFKRLDEARACVPRAKPGVIRFVWVGDDERRMIVV